MVELTRKELVDLMNQLMREDPVFHRDVNGYLKTGPGPTQAANHFRDRIVAHFYPQEKTEEKELAAKTVNNTKVEESSTSLFGSKKTQKEVKPRSGGIIRK